MLGISFDEVLQPFTGCLGPPDSSDLLYRLAAYSEGPAASSFSQPKAITDSAKVQSIGLRDPEHGAVHSAALRKRCHRHGAHNGDSALPCPRLAARYTCCNVAAALSIEGRSAFIHQADGAEPLKATVLGCNMFWSMNAVSGDLSVASVRAVQTYHLSGCCGLQVPQPAKEVKHTFMGHNICWS